MTVPTPRPETIDRLGRVVYPSFAMLAGMQLDLFTSLKDGPMVVEQIAEALGVGPTRLKPLLYALVAAGLLTVDDERFANTPEAGYFLVQGSADYRGNLQTTFLNRWNAVLKTAETIRTGSPQAKVDYAASSPEQLEPMRRSLHPATITAGRDLVTRYDFSSYRSLLDVGGGTGGISLAVTEACPDLRATVVDLPSVTPITQRIIEEAGATQRVGVISADVVNNSLFGSYDVAVLRRLIIVLSADHALRVLKNVSQVIEPGGAIYIIGHVTDNTHVSPPESVGINLWFINIFDEGQAHTEQEIRDWLAEAGFEGIERVTLFDGESIMSARKPM